ncbi:MAG TPA: cytochrome c3 family protein [Anaerolineales bacterium]|nr:cytochrome c3 family protein [Anaerolineales bacterium]
MNTKKLLVLLGTLVVAAALISACAGSAGEPGPQGPAGPAGPAGPEGPAGESAVATDLTCTECHNDTAIITGKKAPWETSVHGAGTAAEYAGGRDGCTGCHSGASFSKMIEAGQTPATYDGTAADVTHQDCRTCHQIHTSFTGEDWALETTAAVELYAFEGVTYDGGEGNLCGVCHQPRRAFAAGEDGMVDVNSTHWGPHHGPQTAMLMGVAGAGIEGNAAAHYSMVEDTCVSCHLGENDNHTFLPTVAACQGCHADIEDFDFSGLQTEVDALAAELAELLEAAGMYEIEADHPVVGIYEADKAAALWNYILITAEDSSHGVHNPSYTVDLLEWSITAMGE